MSPDPTQSLPFSHPSIYSVSMSIIAPSDSASQQPVDKNEEISLILQCYHPPTYPKSVLWTFDEAKTDSKCARDGSNQSKLNMQYAICDTKGNIISPEDWMQIQSVLDIT